MPGYKLWHLLFYETSENCFSLQSLCLYSHEVRQYIITHMHIHTHGAHTYIHMHTLVRIHDAHAHSHIHMRTHMCACTQYARWWWVMWLCSGWALTRNIAICFTRRLWEWWLWSSYYKTRIVHLCKVVRHFRTLKYSTSHVFNACSEHSYRNVQYPEHSHDVECVSVHTYIHTYMHTFVLRHS